MKNLLFVLLFSFCILKNYAQTPDKLRKEYVDFVLTDTMIGFGYFVPLKIKANHTDTLIYYGQVQFLFQYFHETYGWNGKKFMDTLRPYVLFDKVLEIQDNDTAYFLDTYKDLPLCRTCDAFYNETKEDLEVLIKNKKYPRPRSDLFTCLVYKCFKKYIIIGYGEEEIWHMEFPIKTVPIHEVDGTPLD